MSLTARYQAIGHRGGLLGAALPHKQVKLRAALKLRPPDSGHYPQTLFSDSLRLTGRHRKVKERYYVAAYGDAGKRKSRRDYAKNLRCDSKAQPVPSR